MHEVELSTIVICSTGCYHIVDSESRVFSVADRVAYIFLYTRTYQKLLLSLSLWINLLYSCWTSLLQTIFLTEKHCWKKYDSGPHNSSMQVFRIQHGLFDCCGCHFSFPKQNCFELDYLFISPELPKAVDSVLFIESLKDTMELE